MSPFSASASSTASVDSSWPQLIFRLKSAMAAETTQSASRSGSVGGALEGHCERLRAPVYLGRALRHLQSIHLYSYIVSVQSFCGKHTIRSFCLPNIYQIFQIQNKLALMYMISSEIPIFTFIENKNVINVKFMIKKRTISPTATTKPLAGFPLVLFIYTPSLSSNFIKKKKKNPI